MRRIITWACLAPIAIILIVFSVANRHWVNVILDPFNVENPVISFQLPLFVLIFISLILGMLLGSLVTWLKQGKHRKLAREKRFEAEKWRHEADVQKQRLDDTINQNNALPAPTSDAA
jgi:uncharacterized integral membrane protein